MKQLFSEESPPTTVVVDIDNLEHLKSSLYIKVLDAPTTWLGSIVFVHLRSLMAVDKPGALGYRSSYYPRVTEKELSNFTTMFKRHIQFIDSADITLPFHRFTEMRLQFPSQHWHQLTSFAHKNGIPLGKENYPKSWRVTGIVTNMIGQMLFNFEFGSKHLKTSVVSEDPTEDRVKFCLDCPLSFIPIHIFPEPQFTCFESLNFNYEHRSRFESPVCPCNMSNLVVGYVKTMSGDVPIKNCYQ
jgi:hypothetical protein